MTLFTFICLWGFCFYLFRTGKYKNMGESLKKIKNLFAIHPKGPKPVPKNVKPQPFHLNRFKESEIKQHLAYFESVCDFDLEPAGSNNSNINFRTPHGMLFLVQKVTNFKDPKSVLNGYSGTVYIIMDKNKSVLGTFKDREEAMAFYDKRSDEDKTLEYISKFMTNSKRNENKTKEDILAKMKADMMKDFD